VDPGKAFSTRYNIQHPVRLGPVSLVADRKSIHLSIRRTNGTSSLQRTPSLQHPDHRRRQYRPISRDTTTASELSSMSSLLVRATSVVRYITKTNPDDTQSSFVRVEGEAPSIDPPSDRRAISTTTRLRHVTSTGRSHTIIMRPSSFVLERYAAQHHGPTRCQVPRSTYSAGLPHTPRRASDDR